MLEKAATLAADSFHLPSVALSSESSLILYTFCFSIMGMLDTLLQDSISLSLFVGLVILLLVYFTASSIFSSQWHKNEPPGPTPLPFIGNMLQIDLKKPYKTFMEVRFLQLFFKLHSFYKFYKKYGSVFTVHLGPKKVVVLAGYRTVKEALVNHDDVFGDRDAPPIMEEINQGHGVLWSNGDTWREMRRFSLSNLRDFGMGRKVCEDKITEECQQLMEVIKNYKGKPFDTTQPITYAVSNIICSMIYGSRFEYDDPEFECMISRVHKINQLLGSSSVQAYNLFPSLFKWIANRRESYNVASANRKRNSALFSHLKQTLNPETCRGLVDAFLVHKQKLEEAGMTNNHFHDNNLSMTVMNLIVAGSETTSTTLTWGLLFMAKYPQIQDKVEEELREVVGDRQVQAADRRNLPYTNAVIHETQRMANILPMSLPHRTTRDITIQGHFIKKGTTVYPFLMSVLYDESEWEKPHTFHPSHFLDKDGKFVMKDAFMPFSAGCRVCLGESLARMELFMFFTSLLKHFRFSPAPGVSEEDLELTPQTNFSFSPLPHQLCAIPRM